MSSRSENSNQSSRRTFLKYVAGTAGMLSLPFGSALAAPFRNVHPTQMLLTHGVARDFQPRSAEEREIVKRVSDRVKHAFATAASQPLDARFPARGYATIAQRYFRRQSPARLSMARRNASAMLNAPLQQRRLQFGEAGERGAELHRNRPLRDAVVAAQFAKLSRESLREREAMQKAADVFKKSTGSTGSKGKPVGLKLGPGYRKLGFRINSVKCVEETNEVGADEILLGGVAASPLGNLVEIPRWKISNDFDQGETVQYYLPFSPKFDLADPGKGRNLAEFDLWKPGEFVFPGTWTLSLLMGEEDQGGFGDILADLWESIKEDLISYLASEIGEAIGGGIGAIIGGLVAAVVAIVIGWLVALFDNPDDIVGLRTWQLTLLSPFKSYFDTLTRSSLKTPASVWAAPPGVMKFVGDGGRYDVKLHWRVYG